MNVSIAFDTAAWCVAVLFAVPIAVFTLQVLASLLPSRIRGTGGEAASARVTVLVPAHNEEAVIGSTLNSLFTACGPDDRVLVVADNCSDGTAELARELGADVVERENREERGKGYALAFGVDALRDDPPDVLVVVDADCRVTPITLRRLAETVVATDGPVQSLNLVESGAKPSAVQAVSVLGFRFKNLVRALGSSRLGWPCHLTGTGMALPWSIAERVSFGGSNLVEDMQLGIDLAAEGRPATFEPRTLVTSAVPESGAAFATQRSRWESGHLATAFRTVPRLLVRGIASGRPGLIAMAFDLAVPPLSLFVLGWLSATGAVSAAAICGLSPWPAVSLATAGGVLGLSILLGWAVHCRRIVSGRTLLAVPWYVLRKVPLYLSMPFRRAGWVRTARETVSTSEPDNVETIVSDTPRGVIS